MNKSYPSKDNFELAKWEQVKHYACTKCKHIEMVLVTEAPPKICRNCLADAKLERNKEIRAESREKIEREEQKNEE